jgi:hypothetical protein
MARALRLSIVLALIPGVLGFKGCYFGNDRVPLGSNADDGGAGGADASTSSASAGGAGGDFDSGEGAAGSRAESEALDDFDVIAFSFGLELADSTARAEGGAAGQPNQ